MAEQARLAIHTIQLTNVWVERSISARRSRRDSDTNLPNAHISAMGRVAVAADGKSFTGRLRVRLVVEAGDSEAFDATLVLVAAFAVPTGITGSLARRFARSQGLYLVWPFARAYYDQLGAIHGVAVPPLPLLVNPGFR